MRKIIIVTAVLILTLSTLAVSFSDTIDLTYDKALELAVKNSNALETIDDKILLAERELKSAINKSEDVKTSGITSDSVLLENGKIKELYPSQKNEELLSLKEKKGDILSDLEIEVLKYYNRMKNKSESVQFEKNDLVTAKKEYEQMALKYDLGMITKNQLFQYDITVQNIKNNINKLERSYLKDAIEMNRIIGYPIDTQINIEKAIDLSVEAMEYNLVTLLDKAKKNSEEVRDAYNEYLLKDLEKTVINRYSRYEKPDSYEDLEETVIDKKEAYEDAKVTAVINLYNDYYNLLDIKGNLEMANLQLELKDKLLKIEKVKLENELSTYLDYRKAVDAYRSAYEDFQEKELSLFEAKSNFDYKIEKLNRDFESILVN